MRGYSDVTPIKRIFFPYALQEWERVQQNGFRLAYYTRAETAFHILKNREIWMRSTMTMNDSMEVRHGLDCLMNALNHQSGSHFSDVLDSCFPRLGGEVRDHFNAWAPGIMRDTFVTCFSEHLQNEDRYGRLSMWRAYGGKAGVALVMNGQAMSSNSNALAAYLSPVAYMEVSGVADHLKNISDRILANRDYVISLGRDQVRNIVFDVFRFSAICNKHVGFKEEMEWRGVASPALQPSDLMPCEVEVINGIPQTVLKVKLQNNLERGIVGLAITKLLDHIIIGPCENPHVIFRALCFLLEEAGIENPNDKIIISEIPLRTG